VEAVPGVAEAVEEAGEGALAQPARRITNRFTIHNFFFRRISTSLPVILEEIDKSFYM
jgi:hypothetical protein